MSCSSVCRPRKWPDFLARLLAAGFLVGVVSACDASDPVSASRPNPDAGPKPNILLYVVDTLRADGLGAYGNESASTPRFDALAGRGVVFESVFANASWTRSSMASLLTGLLPWHHHTEGRAHRLPEDLATLPSLLEPHGYRCALVSANPNVGSVFGFGRDFESTRELFLRRSAGRVRGAELVAPSDAVTREALAALQELSPPFCLVVLAIDPHSPYSPPERFLPDVLDESARDFASKKDFHKGKLDADQQAIVRHVYQAEIAFNDESFGALIDAIQSRGWLDHTIVAVTSDHGEEFWEYGRRGHGKSLSEEVLHVPLLLHYPGDQRATGGKRIATPGQLIDVLPTLLDLANIESPAQLDGRSLLSNELQKSRVLLSSLQLDDFDLRSARAHPWKLVWDLKRDRRSLYDLRQPEPERVAIPLDADPESSKARKRLVERLARSFADSTGSAESVGELPSDVEAALRALGYLEEPLEKSLEGNELEEDEDPAVE
jgi:arylsulfatase A-like enzyme